MTSRALSRLSRQLIRLAMRVSPRERDEWAQAMSCEAEEIADDREALSWALGCLRVSCHERLRSMRLISLWPVRWGMALWIALLAVDALAYAGFTLSYELGLPTGHFPYPPNVPLLEVTPLWDPILSLVAGATLLLAVVLILSRKPGAFAAVLAPFAVLIWLFGLRLSRPESAILQSLSAAYRKSPSELIWPMAGLAMTILICLALWQEGQTPAAHQDSSGP